MQHGHCRQHLRAAASDAASLCCASRLLGLGLGLVAPASCSAAGNDALSRCNSTRPLDSSACTKPLCAGNAWKLIDSASWSKA